MNLNLNMGTATIMWGILFGSIGFGFFSYGRKQRKIVPLVVGIALIAYPYFITNPYAEAGIGAALMAVPYFIRL
jgi:hypothetical protein